MKQNEKILWRFFIFLTVITMFFCFFVGMCHSADSFYGAGVFAGGQFRSDPLWHTTDKRDAQEFSFVPIIGKHVSDRWDIWIEGRLEYLRWREGSSALKIGALIMTDYNIIKTPNWSLYSEAGVGIGCRSYSPSSNTLGKGVLGFVDYGTGIKYKFTNKYTAKIGLRFEHTSSILGKDTGINTYGTYFAILW